MTAYAARGTGKSSSLLGSHDQLWKERMDFSGNLYHIPISKGCGVKLE